MANNPTHMIDADATRDATDARHAATTRPDRDHAGNPLRHPLAEAEPDANGIDLRARAGALLPEELLQPGEIIILLTKPSPWYIILSAIAPLAAVALVTIAALVLERYNILHLSRGDIILIGFGIIGARLLWQLLEWVSRVYVLTDRRVIRVRGVLRISVFEAPLQQIQHTSTLFSLRERLFGLGSIAFTTAGTATIEAVWEMLPKPLEVHRLVVQTLNRYGRK